MSAARPGPRRTGLGGAPIVVAIGRLIPGKDPLTALGGFEAFQLAHPAARLALIFQGGPLEDAVRTTVQRSLALQGSVRLVGPVPHAAIGDYLGAADLLLSASRAEGSGYAVIEAMACGVTPVVTAIPPHLAIVGDCGATWTPGDARGCAEALTRAWQSDRAAAAAAARARFDAALSWPALAARTVDAYTALAARRPGARRT
ncbi:MAG: glycosyltransferase [Vicinamibacterales bacterium]